jgi:hypothetical protein
MSTAFEETAMRIDLFAHFTTQEFRQAYLSIPLGAKGRRLDPIAIRTFVQAQRTTDIDVLWDMEQRLTVLDRHGIDLQVLTLCFPMVGGLEPEEELRLARLANDGLAEIVQPEFEEPRHTLANSRRKNKENTGRSSPMLSQSIDTRIWKNCLTVLCEMLIV